MATPQKFPQPIKVNYRLSGFGLVDVVVGILILSWTAWTLGSLYSEFARIEKIQSKVIINMSLRADENFLSKWL